MKENVVAKILRVIGYLVAVCGVLAGIHLYNTSENLVFIAVAVAIGSFVVCMLFVGFAEVIFLLEEGIYKQDEIIRKQNQILVENHRDDLM